MKANAISLRQVAVLTVTGLLAPAADLLPGLLSRQAGRAAWLAPVLVLPMALLWTALCRDLCREEGFGLNQVLRQGLGTVLGRVGQLLYIMLAVVVLTSRLAHATDRLGGVYGAEAGAALTAVALGLCRWMVWRGMGCLCRAAELFWLAMGVMVAALLLLSVPQLRPERFLPGWEEMAGLPGAWADCLGVLASAVLALPLAAQTKRGKGSGRLLGWAAAACLLCAALVFAVVGQLGPVLTAKLEQPFSIMVQGLSLEGGIARLEAPVAAFWLLADFAGMALPLAAVRTLAGEKAGRWAALAATLAAGVGQFLLVWDRWAILGGIFLGAVLPAVLWPLCRRKRKKV